MRGAAKPARLVNRSIMLFGFLPFRWSIGVARVSGRYPKPYASERFEDVPDGVRLGARGAVCWRPFVGISAILLSISISSC